MPLPWKKDDKKTKIKKSGSRINRVSRLVADLRSSSSNHGESPLVVQTGFPTSLIHLIVNNWDRINRKPSTNSQNLNTITSSSFEDTSADFRSSVSDGPPPLKSSAAPAIAVAYFEEFDQKSLEDDVCDSVAVHEGEDDEVASRRRRRRRSLVVLVVNMFVFSILAFGTKKLAIGVTFLAFLLLFLEFIGMRFVYFFKPCSDVWRFLNSLAVNVIFVSVQPEMKNVPKSLEHSLLMADSLNLSRAKIEEIQLIESEFDVRRNDISCEASNLTKKKKIIWPPDDFVIEDQTVVASPRKMSNAKFKEKLVKKLVILKKIRGSKSKRNKEIETNRCVTISNCTVTEDKLTVGEQKKEDKQQLKGNELEEIDEEHRRVVLPQLSCNDTDVEDLRKMVNWNSAHLIPLVIVLTGLLGGRVMSLVLTMTCCTLSRLARLQKIHR